MQCRELMRFIDRAFALTLTSFAVGSLCGFTIFLAVPALREGMMMMLKVRVASPILAATSFGNAAILLLVFVNNMVPVVLALSFPQVLSRIRWDAPPSTLDRLNAAFSLLTGFLIGFLNLGGILAFALTLGPNVFDRLLSESWLHAPIELFLVLVAVSEPIRLALRRIKPSIHDELPLLILCAVGLLASALVEVYLKL